MVVVTRLAIGLGGEKRGMGEDVPSSLLRL